MRYIILFEDAPDADPGLRIKNMPAHLDFLESAAPQLLSAGPLRDGDGQPAGGLWIVEAESLAEVEDLIRRDPLFATGLRKSWAVHAWTRVFDHGQRLPLA
ncbi:MAG TPA: YciI family protein [Albidovulum sp.]|uniref:YciI family protein n=1 Tax=Albidovulum sp. TaxID=1872424 RepID=UPI002BD43645|nr:YciI family protein [Albidovulum sp.]